MSVDQQDTIRTFVLVPERDLGHAIADKLFFSKVFHDCFTSFSKICGIVTNY